MKFKKLMFVAIFLMAIFAVGAVSAADNVTQDKILEDVASEEPIASNDMKDSLSEDDVRITIHDTVDMEDEYDELCYVSDGDGLNGTVTVYVDGNSTYTKDFDSSVDRFPYYEIYLNYLNLPKDFSWGNHIVNLTYLKNGITPISLQKTVDFSYDFRFSVIDDDEAVYGNNLNFNVYVPENATNTITVTFNGKTYTANPDNGRAQFIVPMTLFGNNTIYATYAGDSKYPAKTINKTITVLANIVYPEYISVGENKFISIKLPTGVTGTVYIYDVDQDSDNKTLVATVPVSGSADIYSLKSLAKKDRYLYYVNYTIDGVEDGEYVSFEVKENTPGFSATVPSSITTGETVNVIFNSPVDTNDFVNIYIDDTSVRSIRVSNRMASEVISGLGVGTHKIKVLYNDYVNFYSNTFTVEVKDKPAPPVSPTVTLSLSTAKVKKSAKKLVLKAKLLIDNKAVSGKVIKFKFNGKTYKAKTDKKGIAKAAIKHSVLKKLKVGKKVKYSASYGSKSVQKTAKVKK